MNRDPETTSANALVAAPDGAGGGACGRSAFWRPEPAFIAQIIGARVRPNRLAEARAGAGDVLGAYGSAAALATGTASTLDRRA